MRSGARPRLIFRTDATLDGAEHAGDAAHAAQPAGSELVIGTLRLCLERRELIGPHGQVQLAPALFLLAETLMRRPGAVADVATLGKALRAAPACQAERGRLQDHVQALRAMVLVLTRERMQLPGGPETGYAIRDRRAGGK